MQDARRHRAGEMPRHRPPETPPRDPAERFRARVDALMKSSGRDRTWATARVAEEHPREAAAAFK